MGLVHVLTAWRMQNVTLLRMLNTCMTKNLILPFLASRRRWAWPQNSGGNLGVVGKNWIDIDWDKVRHVRHVSASASACAKIAALRIEFIVAVDSMCLSLADCLPPEAGPRALVRAVLRSEEFASPSLINVAVTGQRRANCSSALLFKPAVVVEIIAVQIGGRNSGVGDKMVRKSTNSASAGKA